MYTLPHAPTAVSKLIKKHSLKLIRVKAIKRLSLMVSLKKKKSFILLPLLSNKVFAFAAASALSFTGIIMYHLFLFNDIINVFLKIISTLLLIKHDGFRVLVCHLGHVSQNILFCDDAKKSPGVERKQRKDQPCTMDLFLSVSHCVFAT